LYGNENLMWNIRSIPPIEFAGVGSTTVNEMGDTAFGKAYLKEFVMVQLD
jgi:hypothetical protein